MVLVPENGVRVVSVHGAHTTHLSTPLCPPGARSQPASQPDLTATVQAALGVRVERRQSGGRQGVCIVHTHALGGQRVMGVVFICLLACFRCSSSLRVVRVAVIVVVGCR